ncbi:MAG TPA: LD-carboxypeptidase [Cytophagales bacterium]|nr:LD-carboxypeptidase [Cytophagales bacterium]HAA23405.1 LD-carboxypeptidase [Cytophagales bacterium]HAP58114.1 LD-carboxypeptidase [Cytophagales bacterium]
MGILVPSKLNAGDEVIIVATANKVDKKAIFSARDMLSTWGLRVRFGQHLLGEDFEFSGTDSQRLEDLQAALDDPTAKAVLAARGGYGTSRLIDHLNLSGLKKHPKWIVGYSDLTAIHGWLVDQGIVSLHATMPQIMIREEEHRSAESLRRVLFGNWPIIEVEGQPENRFGEAKGRVVGGNLSLLVHAIGTLSDVATRGRILFLEDVGEKHYHIDRMMVQMRRSGKLSRLAGLVVGGFSDLEDEALTFGKTAYQIIAEHVSEYSYPVGMGFPIGHVAPNLALPLGRDAHLSVTASGTILNYR